MFDVFLPEPITTTRPREHRLRMLEVAADAGRTARAVGSKEISTVFSSFRRFLLTLAMLLGGSQAALALDVGPTSVPVKILDVPIDIMTTASIDIHTNADKLALEVSAVGDLKGLQDKALEIARRLPFPQDPCARKGANLVVNSIDAAHISPAGTAAVIEVSGHATAWGCAKMLGAKVKTEILSDTVTITIPLELYVPDPQQIALRVGGPVDVKTGNPQTAEAVSAVVGDLNGKLTAAIAKALDSSKARAAVPPIPGLDIHIEEASFAQDQDKLLVKTHLKGSATAEALGALTAMAAKKAAP